MNNRKMAAAVMSVLALQASMSRASDWMANYIIAELDQTIATQCASPWVSCYADHYLNAANFYWYVFQTYDAMPCSEFPGGCNEKNDWLDTYSRVYYHCTDRYTYFNGM